MKVKVYWNLNKNCWSVQHKGKVVYHLPKVKLINVSFKVSEAGRQRVIKEGRKNVHAFVVGNLVLDNTPKSSHKSLGSPITYNPYTHSCFHYKASKLPSKAFYNSVLCNDDRLVYPVKV